MLGVTVPHEMTCFVLFLLRALTPPREEQMESCSLGRTIEKGRNVPYRKSFAHCLDTLCR